MTSLFAEDLSFPAQEVKLPRFLSCSAQQLKVLSGYFKVVCLVFPAQQQSCSLAPDVALSMTDEVVS